MAATLVARGGGGTAVALADRIVCRCRSFVVLMTAALRVRGRSARARCGFANYLSSSKEDHWICEVREGERWRKVDPQLDAVWTAKLGLDEAFAADLPADAFLSASEAWLACRSGDADPSTFGLSFEKLQGLWFVAGNLVRDLAALAAKVEMLPWDVWGAMPSPNATIPEADLVLFDDLARLMADPDAHLDELQALYKAEPRLRVPPAVYNALTNQSEHVPA